LNNPVTPATHLVSSAARVQPTTAGSLAGGVSGYQRNRAHALIQETILRVALSEENQAQALREHCFRALFGGVRLACTANETALIWRMLVDER
jgi:hypothetical protein